jgi:hypothetical protein
MKLLDSMDKPIIAIVSFNLFTLAVFLTAPVRWDTHNLVTLSLLVSCSQLLLLIGFRIGRNRGSLAHAEATLLLSSGDRFTKYLFAFYAATFLIGYAYRMGLSILDVAAMYDLLLAGVRDRHAGYEMALRGTGLGPVPWTAFFLVSVLDQLFFVVGFLQWRRLNSIQRVLLGIFVCFDVFFSTGRGTAFGVISMITTFFWSSLLYMDSTRLRIRHVFGRLVLAIVLFLASVGFFAYNLYARSSYTELQPEDYEFGRSTVDVDHPAFALVPEGLQSVYMNVVSYFGQGYYHTCLAFDLDFRSTWFLGNNPALISLASIVGLDVWEDTYMHRLESVGVDEFGAWHSAYTWFASDVSFYGVPLLLFFLGYSFGFSWAKAVRGDLLSKIVFTILGNMLLFLFANNTYLSAVFYSFMFLWPWWILTRLCGVPRAASLPS